MYNVFCQSQCIQCISVPSLQVKCTLVLHLISAAFSTAALGLMSKHLPYRQDSYHCEHCWRLELHAVVTSHSNSIP